MPRDLPLSLITVPITPGMPALVLHAGAGGHLREPTPEATWAHRDGLTRAFEAGEKVLIAGGTALDAVCATVCALEDDPLFNAGRGAALTVGGHAEMDAAVMTGDGRAGAVACSRDARHPVLAARAVMERTDHVLLVDPRIERIRQWGLRTEAPEYFVTELRRAQLRRVLDGEEDAARHGTVGAVAIDAGGAIAAATSTGGMTAQADGRVGDTPVIGAGTFARTGVVGISCTGEGEAFLRGVVAHDVAARIMHGRATLPEAVSGTIGAELTARDGSGGMVCLDRESVVLAHNSPAMFAAWRDGEEIRTQA